MIIKNGRYYFRKQIEGRIYWKALGLKKGQESLLSTRLKQVEEQIIANHFGLPYKNFKPIRFSQFIQEYEKRKVYKASLDRDLQRLAYICDALGDPYLNQITTEQLIKLEKKLLKDGRSSATANRYFQILRHFFNLAKDEGYIKNNPLSKWEFFIEDKKGRALKIEEIKIILQVSKKIQDHPLSDFQKIWYDFIMLAFLTGMRLSEIIFLKNEYIKYGYIEFPITKTKYRKKGRSIIKKTKIIYLPKPAKAIIKKYQSDSGYLFPIKRRDPNIVFWTIQRIRRETGIKDFTFHMIRHTVATMITQNFDIYTAKLMLGHADLKTTEGYIHAQKITETVEKTEELFRRFLLQVIEK
ncbi:MAG: site-specific integrase [Candidatus Aminicenantes bacterium]|nr:site-specific integrase [Candidatus Aminicenantes bacterium]